MKGENGQYVPLIVHSSVLFSNDEPLDLSLISNSSVILSNNKPYYTSFSNQDLKNLSLIKNSKNVSLRRELESSNIPTENKPNKLILSKTQQKPQINKTIKIKFIPYSLGIHTISIIYKDQTKTEYRVKCVSPVDIGIVSIQNEYFKQTIPVDERNGVLEAFWITPEKTIEKLSVNYASKEYKKVYKQLVF